MLLCWVISSHFEQKYSSLYSARGVNQFLAGEICWFLHCNGPLHIIQAQVDIKSCQYYFAEWYQAILRQKQINNLDSKYLYLPKYKPDINHHLPNNNRPIRLLDTQEAIKHINRDKKINKKKTSTFDDLSHTIVIIGSFNDRFINAWLAYILNSQRSSPPNVLKYVLLSHKYLSSI